jgi:WD40 repeat protein
MSKQECRFQDANMFRRLITGLLVLCFTGLPTLYAQDTLILSDEPPYPCPYTNGAYYQPGVFPRYDAATRSLILVNGDGSFLRTLAPIEDNVRIINWSPDCRYLSAMVGSIRLYRENTYYDGNFISWNQPGAIIFWDAIAGSQEISLPTTGKYLDYQPVQWSPSGNFALILAGCGDLGVGCVRERLALGYLWFGAEDRLVRVGGAEGEFRWRDGTRAYFNQVEWDLPNNRIWASGFGGAVAYDLSTGLETAFYPACRPEANCALEARFFFSDDGSRIVVYGIQNRDRGNERNGIAVYTLNDGVGTYVNSEIFSAPYIPFADYHHVALSADNRYLIAGYDAIRVWDIQNLPEAFEDRLPIYRHGGPDALIDSLRFSDWGVIETTSADGVQRWDLHTGVYIP